MCFVQSSVARQRPTWHQNLSRQVTHCRQRQLGKHASSLVAGCAGGPARDRGRL